MTDDQQVRALLHRAAELPDTIQPPVARLVETARRRRRLQVVLSLLGVAAITAAGFTLPSVLKGPGGVAIPTRRTGAPPHRATAAELARARWALLPPSPLGPRSNPILVSGTGMTLLEIGGTRNGHARSDGALFDPGTGWERIARPPADVGLRDAVSVWTGPAAHQLFVTNNIPPSSSAAGTGAPAGLYDPVTNRWTVTDLPRQMLGLQLTAPVWTGHDVVLAGSSGSARTPRIAVAAYNVADHRWRMITPRLPARHPAGLVSMVAAWQKVILWSFWSRDITFPDGSGTIRSGVDVLVLHHGRWTTSTGGWPQHWIVEGAAFASFRILIPPGQFWCGDCPGPFGESPARLADAGTLALTTIPASPLVTHPTVEPPVWRWNGSSVLAADVSGYSKAAPNGRLGRLAAYDPLSRRWLVLPRAPGDPALAAAPVLDRRGLLVLTLDGRLLSLGKRR
ncbi:MAG TPA: hypothetical protein VF162_09215 [Streptosporangiaceae bacterium]